MMEYVWSIVNSLIIYLFALCFFKPKRIVGNRIDFAILIVIAAIASFINHYLQTGMLIGCVNYFYRSCTWIF